MNGAFIILSKINAYSLIGSPNLYSLVIIKSYKLRALIV